MNEFYFKHAVIYTPAKLLSGSNLELIYRQILQHQKKEGLSAIQICELLQSNLSAFNWRLTVIRTQLAFLESKGLLKRRRCNGNFGALGCSRVFYYAV